MKTWTVVTFAVIWAGCDSNHCGSAQATIGDAGASDAAIERIAVMLPEAGAETSGAGGDSSSITVSGTFNRCPDIVAATASPPVAAVGATVTVGVIASDADPGDVLRYTWTALEGLFAMPSAASTTYTCSAEGAWQVTVTVSDGHCDQITAVMVTCKSTVAPGS